MSTFLVVMIVANAGTALVYFLNPGPITQRFPTFSTTLLLALGVGALINIVLALMVWQWRRIGVYGFVVMAVVVFGINLNSGIPLLQSILGLLGPAILALLVRQKWNRFS